MSNKIIKGVELAYQRLLIANLKYDYEVLFSRDSKMVFIKARDLMNEK